LISAKESLSCPTAADLTDYEKTKPADIGEHLQLPQKQELVKDEEVAVPVIDRKTDCMVDMLRCLEHAMNVLVNAKDQMMKARAELSGIRCGFSFFAGVARSTAKFNDIQYDSKDSTYFKEAIIKKL
jgi:hypothetical protein